MGTSEARIEALTSKLAQAERRLRAVAAGVPVERADRYVLLAETYLEGGDDFDAALTAALGEFPLKAEEKKAQAPRVVAPASPGDAHKRWKRMTLSERVAIFQADPALAREMAAKDGEPLRGRQKS